jgi:hypothetical protein
MRMMYLMMTSKTDKNGNTYLHCERNKVMIFFFLCCKIAITVRAKSVFYENVSCIFLCRVFLFLRMALGVGID